MRDNTTKFHDILTRYKQVMAEVEQLTLTGRQIKFVRNELGESQMAFAKRIEARRFPSSEQKKRRKTLHGSHCPHLPCGSGGARVRHSE